MFHRLFDMGDTSAHGGDDSSADLGLCNILAFWTGKDAAQMDAIFRQSGRMRPKWDERRGAQTYGEMTITKAIQDCREVYTGEPARATPAQDFGQLEVRQAVETKGR